MNKTTKNQIKKARGQQSSSTIAAQEPLSNLVHKLGHEIGNPLTAIISLSSILPRISLEAQQDAIAKLQDYANSITQEAWRISRLSEQLVLLLSTKSTNTSPCALDGVIEQAARRLRSRLPAQCDKLVIDIRGADHLPDISLDADQSVIMFSELLLNAWQASCAFHKSAKDSLAPSPILVQFEHDATSVLVSICNRADKPCSENLEDLFLPLVTADSYGNKIGLGLSVALAVAERQGATLEIEERVSDDGIFFTAHVRVPCETTPEEMLNEDSYTPADAFGVPVDELPEKLAILVIEDEAMVASAMEKILELAFASKTNFSFSCIGGAEVAEYLENNASVDAILCDLNLGVTSGRRVFDLISERWPELSHRFAFLTGEKVRQETQKYLKSCGQPFLHKPFEPTDLVDLVLQLIKKGQKQN